MYANVSSNNFIKTNDYNILNGIREITILFKTI